MMRKQVGAEQKSTNGSKSAHGIHEANVHGTGISLDVVVYISCAQSEERRTSATKQELQYILLTVFDQKHDGLAALPEPP